MLSKIIQIINLAIGIGTIIGGLFFFVTDQKKAIINEISESLKTTIEQSNKPIIDRITTLEYKRINPDTNYFVIKYRLSVLEGQILEVKGVCSEILALQGQGKQTRSANIEYYKKDVTTGKYVKTDQRE